MNSVRNLLGKVDKTVRANKPYLFTRSATDSRILNEITTVAGHLSERWNFLTWCIRITRLGQFGRQKQLGNFHGLIDEDLFLVLIALMPSQNIFKRNDGWFEF